MKDYIVRPQGYGVLMNEGEVIAFVKINKDDEKTKVEKNKPSKTKEVKKENIDENIDENKESDLRDEVKNLAKEKIASGKIDRSEIKQFIEKELKEECIADLNEEKLNKLKEKLEG